MNLTRRFGLVDRSRVVTGALPGKTFLIAAHCRARVKVRGEWWLILAGHVPVIFGILQLAQPGAAALTVLSLIGISV